MPSAGRETELEHVIVTQALKVTRTRDVNVNARLILTAARTERVSETSVSILVLEPVESMPCAEFGITYLIVPAQKVYLEIHSCNVTKSQSTYLRERKKTLVPLRLAARTVSAEIRMVKPYARVSLDTWEVHHSADPSAS